MPWNEAPDWQKKSALDGVLFHQGNDKTPEESHEAWFLNKAEEGWEYGEVKDEEKKLHPCMVPYDELTTEQKAKDYIFSAIVAAMSSMAPINSSTISIKYIGARPQYTDGIYGTNVSWKKDESKMVPIAQANKMLKHADVWVDGDVVDEITDEKKDEDDELNLEAVKVAVKQLNRKAPLIEFAKNNFSVNLKKQDTVASLQEQCINLIDRFGMP